MLLFSPPFDEIFSVDFWAKEAVGPFPAAENSLPEIVWSDLVVVVAVVVAVVEAFLVATEIRSVEFL